LTPHRARVAAAAAIDPDNASILVCGGGGVALSVTRKLKDMGSWVWQMQVRGGLLGVLGGGGRGPAGAQDETQAFAHPTNTTLTALAPHTPTAMPHSATMTGARRLRA
jgi:hypothetical protein